MLMEAIQKKAKADIKRIVMPEGNEPRTVKAAAEIQRQGYAIPILLGDAKKAKELAEGADISGIEIIDPVSSLNAASYAKMFYELRKDKGVTGESAKETMKDSLFYGAMMLKTGEADGMVAGAIHTTGDVLRPALQIIKTAPGISIVSSCFLMEMPEGTPYAKQVFVFADCAVNPNPDAKQLAAIAISSAATAKSLVGFEPKVAMLSFSTNGSAKHELVDKVVEATKIAKELAPDLKIEGEMQADAAIVDSVGELKFPGSAIAGKANVLIFPDLQSGNIGYKLVQRFAGAEAIGPVCQGMAKPVNDLSRGCSVSDIVAVASITAVQAQ